jgi:hypothetical protein
MALRGMRGNDVSTAIGSGGYGAWDAVRDGAGRKGVWGCGAVRDGAGLKGVWGVRTPLRSSAPVAMIPTVEYEPGTVSLCAGWHNSSQ